MSTTNILLDRIEFLACENMTLRKSIESLNHEINKLHDKLSDNTWVEQNQTMKIRELEEQVLMQSELINKYVINDSDNNLELIAKEICNKHNNSPDKRIVMIRDFRNVTKCSLRDAKDMIDKLVPFPG